MALPTRPTCQWVSYCAGRAIGVTELVASRDPVPVCELHAGMYALPVEPFGREDHIPWWMR